MLKEAKRLLLRTAKTAGLYSLVGRSRWRTSRLLILGYHGISLNDEHLWNPSLYFSQPALFSRMNDLAECNCNVLGLQDALDKLENGTLPERAVAITFDDGTYDFIARAYPVLKQFNYPVTVYQTTFYCSHQHPVFHGISSYILWKGRDYAIDGREFTGVPGKLNLGAKEDRDLIALRIWQYADAEKMSVLAKNHLVERLALQLGVDFQRSLDQRIIHLMNPRELAQLAQDGVDIQLHTHRHRTPRDRTLFLREIEDNRNFLRQVAPLSLNQFCYPSGDYDMRFLPWLESVGVESAVTCDPGFVEKTTNPLILPRLIDTSSLSSTEFRGWLCGLSQFLPRRSTARQF